MPTADGQVEIRFRHISGDVGPFHFPTSATILNLKERVCQEWQQSTELVVAAIMLEVLLSCLNSLLNLTNGQVCGTCWGVCIADGTQIDGDTVKTPSHLKLIFNGKFLEDGKELKGAAVAGLCACAYLKMGCQNCTHPHSLSGWQRAPV